MEEWWNKQGLFQNKSNCLIKSEAQKIPIYLILIIAPIMFKDCLRTAQTILLLML